MCNKKQYLVFAAFLVSVHINCKKRYTKKPTPTPAKLKTNTMARDQAKLEIIIKIYYTKNQLPNNYK